LSHDAGMRIGQMPSGQDSVEASTTTWRERK
jgi:hypothetical protein